MGAQQQQINYGAAVNDGQGDPLRTAFIKTDDNFDAIWAAGPVGSNIVISNNNITATNTNGDLRLGTNGTGNIRALRHVIPTGNRLYDLGAANLRFGTVYANSLDVVNFGISTLSVNVIQSDDSAFVLVNDGLEVNGNIAANSIFTTSIQSSDSSMVTINDGLDVNGNVSAAYFVGDGSQLTNLPTVSTYSNANVTAFLGSGLNTSIIPAANATYSLGDASHYWSNLWVAANTIYIGGVALGVSGNVLTVAGEPVLSNDSATDITTTGNIAAQEITATGDFTGGNVEIRTAQLRLAPAASQSTLSLRPDGGIGVVGINLPNNATANTVDLAVENNAGNVLIKSAGLDGWLFGADNVLTAPGNITANYFIGNGSLLTGIAAGTGNITFSDTTISAPDDESMTLQVRDSEQLVRSSLVLDSDYGATRLASFSAQEEASYNILDWSTATWTGNSLDFVDAPDIAAFASDVYGDALNREFSINGGARLPYDGFGRDGNNISFATTVAADPDPTTVTTIEFFYQYQSRIQMDYDDEEILIQARGMDIIIDGDDDIRIQAADNIDIEAGGSIDIDADEQIDIRSYSVTDPVRIITDASTGTTIWAFGADGTLTTPGDIVVAGDVTGTAGANTLVLKAQPASNTSIQLNSIVDSVISTVANLEIRTDVSNTAKTWEFDTTGNLTLPAGGFLDVGGGIVARTGASPAPYLSGFSSLSTAGAGGNISASGNLVATANVFGSYGIFTGNISGGNIITTGNVSGNTAGYAIGYRDIPQVSFTGNATIAATDAGRHFYSTESTDYILTIADNSAVSWPVGTAITVVNRGTGNITVAQASGVSLYLAGNSTAGNRTVTTYGMVTLLNVAANVWMINGTGVA